jgi:elongation factor Ts
MVTIANIQYLRKMTGAGVLDCKNALNEANGDYDIAVEIIRKKGKMIARKRADRDAIEGCVLAARRSNFAAIVAVRCETDFVAKGEKFIGMVKKILDLALEIRPKNIEELNNFNINGCKICELITDYSGVSGEKIELGFYEYLIAPTVEIYVHSGNKLATIVGFNQNEVDVRVAKDIAMQVAAMNPVSVDKNSIPLKIIEKERKIAREIAIEQGKSELVLNRIEDGALNKYYKDYTLLLQNFVKNPKITVGDFLKNYNKDLSVVDFRRVCLNVE